MLKRFQIIFWLWAFVFCLKGQTNLVPNPSFELYSSCPNNQGQVPFANGWVGAGDTPDYFNTCDITVPDFSAPYNWGGYQIPASGNAYCGIGTYLSETIYPNVREFIGTSLSSALVNGTKYFISFKTSLAIDTAVGNCATNNLGALFTVNDPSSTLNSFPNIGNYFPQINNSALITDSTLWTTVFGSFIADSSYQNIFIGNFFSDSNTDTLIINNADTTVINGKNICYAYYYIDDVCVSTDSIFTLNYHENNIKKSSLEHIIEVYPNPASDFLFINNKTNNVISFYLINSLSEKISVGNIPGYSSYNFNISLLPKGIYYLIGDSFLIQKIMKQ